MEHLFIDMRKFLTVVLSILVSIILIYIVINHPDQATLNLIIGACHLILGALLGYYFSDSAKKPVGNMPNDPSSN